MKYRTTAEVAEQLGCSAYTLNNLIRRGQLAAPARFAGVFAWAEADVRRAEKALAALRPPGRPRREVAHAS
jgi:excisionase family DNA binding protein